MPITYRVSPEERIVHLNVEGESSFDELKGAVLAALSDPGYRPDFDFLGDRTRETVAPDCEYIRRVVGLLREHASKMGSYRWATVCRRPAAYGMQRMFSLLAESHGVRAEPFRDMEEARRWLLGSGV